MTNPTVTCLCLTRNRRDWLPKAIASFLAQTYEPRTLLIVGDGEPVDDLIPADPRIEFLQAREGMSIGEKRNIGAAHAAGEIICHTDDDDYSAPGRIADQVARLAETGKSVTGYHSIRFTDGTAWWKYNGTPDWAFDTSLCYRKEFWAAHPFDEINDGLEARFRTAAIREKRFVSADGSDLMYANTHAGNTSRRVIGEGWTETTPTVTANDAPHGGIA
jgi:glycosyltransferase involved in cell wall biosynthesis